MSVESAVKRPRNFIYFLAGGKIFSYFFAGLIPIIPYVLPINFWLTRLSILLTLGSLFLLGVASGRFLNIHPIRQGTRMIIMGGAAIFVGVVIGKIFSL